MKMIKTHILRGLIILYTGRPPSYICIPPFGTDFKQNIFVERRGAKAAISQDGKKPSEK